MGELRRQLAQLLIDQGQQGLRCGEGAVFNRHDDPCDFAHRLIVSRKHLRFHWQTNPVIHGIGQTAA